MSATKPANGPKRTAQTAKEKEKSGPDGPSFTRGALPPAHAVARYKEAVAPHVQSFNYFLDQGLDGAINDIMPQETRLSEDGESGPIVKLWVEECEVGFPRRAGEAIAPLTPRECRERNLMYAGPLRATFCVQLEGKEPMRFQRQMGDLPIMVGSNRCRLAGKTPAELVELKEEATEAGGYFVVNGIERVIRLLQEATEAGGYFVVNGIERVIRLLQVTRRNHAMAITRSTFKNRGQGYTDKGVMMRCVRPGDQTSVTVTIHSLHNGSAICRFNILKQEFLVPVVLILKALRDITDNELYQRLICGDESNTYLVTRVEMLLRESKEFASFTRKKALAYLGERFRLVLNMTNARKDEEVGRVLLDRVVCVHVASHADKQECLLFMLRKLYAFVQGRGRADNPDSLMNHELLLPGHLWTMFVKEKIEEAMAGCIVQVRKECREHLERVLKASQDETYWQNMLQKHTGAVGKKAAYLLSTGNLISRSGLDLQQVSGFTIVAERLNFFRFISHFRSVHRGQFFTTMKTTTVRKLLPESFGFLCPVHTPDGAPCGLLNHLAIASSVLTHPPPSPPMSPDVLISLGVSPAGAGSVDGSVCLPKDYLPVLLDGRFVGGALPDTCKSVVTALRRMKVNGGVPASLEVAYLPPVRGGPFPGVYVFTSPARLVRPVLQLESGAVELIGPMEQVFMDIALLPEDIRDGETTHRELDPTNMLSLVASLTPFSDYNQSPRNMYQCQMGKQTMGTPAQSYLHRPDNKLYRILFPQAPIVQTRRHAEYGMDEFPQGTNAVVAVISYTGYDMEDAMILNKASYHRGFGAADVYKTKTVSLKKDMRAGRRPYLRFSNTRTPAVVAAKKVGGHNGPVGGKLCADLDGDGLPVVGTWVKEGQPLYCAVDSLTGDVEIGKHKESESAIVETVRVLGSDSGNDDHPDSISITLRFPRRPIIGDKFSSRHGQKGVLSILWPQENMPFSESGMTPDVIINPHAFPSRMTIGMLIESMAGKSGALHGTFQDSTPFNFHEESRAVDYFGEQLRAAGYAYYGSEPLYSGISGTVMHADIFIGLVYYQRLRHMVSDKSQVRATGMVNQLTRQPIKGRKRHGGIRFGEMERDALLSHGTSFLLHDRLMNCSDRHIAHTCVSCGSLIGPRLERSAILSAAHTGVITAAAAIATSQGQAKCQLCGGKAREVVLPYVFRYLVNELAAMNIKVSLGTRDA